MIFSMRFRSMHAKDEGYRISDIRTMERLRAAF